MIPPSTKELIDIGSSKYAVVVAVAKRARDLSENKKMMKIIVYLPW